MMVTTKRDVDFLSRHGMDAEFFRRLSQSGEQACRWLVDIAQVRESHLTDERHPGFPYTDWRGAIRGEYNAASRQWAFFCPYWHTGQAIKGLLMFDRHIPSADWRKGARLGGDFMLRQHILDRENPDFGLALAYEDIPFAVNVSAILEGLDGLFMLADVDGDAGCEAAALHALDWVANHAYCWGKGLFHDFYDPVERRFFPLSEFRPTDRPELPRPLLDDGVFLSGYHRGGDHRFREIFLETADQLVATERPSGNWIIHGPCNERDDYIHPRHAYWWGMPMLDAWRETGEARYREMALRSAEWYARALRRDGGFFRLTGSDFNSDSFNHATSGSACAAIFFLRVYLELDDPRYLRHAAKALNYCIRLQFTCPEDSNLKGAILEKVMPPDGTDRSPYHIRDLGTIFFVQAAALALECADRLGLKR